jgi:ribose transport system substrate-binding protein
MKKVVLFLLVFSMVSTLFIGCAKTKTEEPEPSTTETPAKSDQPAEKSTEQPAETSSDYKYPGAVGKTATLILKDLTNPVWIQAAEGAEAAAKEFGLELEVVAPVVSNNNDEQIQLVEQAIAKKKDILILTPADSTGIVPAVTQLNEANIPVINLNTKINNESGKANSETFVVADNITCATLCATELAKLAGEQGEAIILQGPSGGQVTIDLTKGAEDTFAKYPGIKIVDKKDAKFDRATGYKTTQDMLQAHPNLKIIFSCNDEMALGAVQALDEAGKLQDIVVGGIDGNQDALASIKAGKMKVTVFKNFWLQAYTAVEAAAKFLDGQKLEPLIPIDLCAVTIDNVDEFLEK